ncbi:MAG: nitroreductase family protein, partial [Bacteroidota bacterium]
EKGFGGCIVASIDRDKLRQALDIDKRFKILQVIALGKPKETVIIEEIEKDGDIKYWRDDKHIHHVPKRKLDDIIINL